jgi:cyd operon protein YbgT
MWYFTWLLGIGFAVLLAILNALWAEHEAGREAGKGPAMAIDLYARLGPDGIARLVDRLYHWMTVLPEAHASHLLHRADLSEVSRRLTAFLSGWLGGRTYRAPTASR